MERFLDICGKEYTAPRCIFPTCSSLYTLQHIPPDRSIQKQYQLCLFRGLLKEQESENNQKNDSLQKQKALFLKIREERLLFLSQEFPSSIQRAVHILYGNELRRIHKNNEVLLQQQLLQMETKRCFRLFCQGSMEGKRGVGYENVYENVYENWECTTCHSCYCKSCEKNWTSTHQCQQEDIASIEWKKSLPHCPHCSLPIEKVDGCDAITCAGCQKNFNYSTGLPCESGNHGKTIPISLPKESVKEVWKVLLNGRSKKDKQFTLKEKQMMKMLEDIELGIETYNISSFSKPTWEWSIYDIPNVQQWLTSLSSNSPDSTPSSIDPQQEENIAKLVASRVDKLETRRQHIHHILKTLGSIEDELQSSIPTKL
jgi:hypothetical protein